MIQEFQEAGALALMCGLIASVYRGVLAYEQPFSLWWRLGNYFERTWIFRPLWACEKCFAGQMAFWIYIFQRLHWVKRPPASRLAAFLPYSWNLEGYWLLPHFFGIAGAIFSAIIFSSLLKRFNDRQ